LISFGFRKKRHRTDSRDAPLTSTPTTTFSATGGRAFLLPSKSNANLLSSSPSSRFPCATQIHCAVRCSARVESSDASCTLLHADRTPKHRSTAAGLLVEQCARRAVLVISDCTENDVNVPPFEVGPQQRRSSIDPKAQCYVARSTIIVGQPGRSCEDRPPDADVGK
jgi:hypothetical protein